jgi:hypothetical protein
VHLLPSKAKDGDHSHSKITTTITIAAANNKRGHAEQDQLIKEYGIVVPFGDGECGQLGCGDGISELFTPLVLDWL